MRELYRRHLSRNQILVLFILTNVLFLIMTKVTIPKVSNYAGGMELPDLMPEGYTFEYIKTLFTMLGQEGRNAYLSYQIPLDMVYPGLFAITYSLIIAFFMNKLRIFEWGLFYAVLFPILGGFFDYCENLGFINMLASFPDMSHIVAGISNVCSILKSTFSTITFAVVIILLVVYVVKSILMKKMI